MKPYAKVASFGGRHPRLGILNALLSFAGSCVKRSRRKKVNTTTTTSTITNISMRIKDFGAGTEESQIMKSGASCVLLNHQLSKPFHCRFCKIFLITDKQGTAQEILAAIHEALGTFTCANYNVFIGCEFTEVHGIKTVYKGDVYNAPVYHAPAGPIFFSSLKRHESINSRCG